MATSMAGSVPAAYGGVLIAGPTASGKSALAIALAQRLGGAVVNADSMQVYRDLRILSARPSLEEEAQAPHHLYGSVDGAVNFSAAAYADSIAALLPRLDAAGQVPIVVGGTGLYFAALTTGLSAIPPVPEPVRAAFRARVEALPTETLHAELLRRDAAMAGRLRPNDRLRVMRALEVLEATGRSLSAFQGARQPGPLAGRRLVRLFLAPERVALRARIDTRFKQMIEAGALDEVAALRARGLDPLLPVMRAHGVPGLIAHLDGMLSRAEAIARGQADTRSYAKRQFTWFRHQMPDFEAVAPEAGLAAALARWHAPDDTEASRRLRDAGLRGRA